eukprot:CAMPEP_0197671222 /NCGR_PEP_ID=MMETSP1338-20131121/76246_1 /TAXON_ID=43686 ORGANISM="Pelagodinium beii, Strain RCC1491" /NCGR_SAMPLE_ID=MMETSP1338 /ASSEMBLY_ACC=CAM_ASM_000754 /LENGTH=73 /DNA_ID=CAMNT_0043251079 /DNA_START=158 /DNA_END=376 /DNA_ORIENTATION=+
MKIIRWPMSFDASDAIQVSRISVVMPDIPAKMKTLRPPKSGPNPPFFLYTPLRRVYPMKKPSAPLAAPAKPQT